MTLRPPSPPPFPYTTLFRSDLVPGWQDKLPIARLSLSADVPDPEWSWRVDEGTWSKWTRDSRPMVRSKSFLMQGDYVIEIGRAHVGTPVTSSSHMPSSA